MAHLNGKWALYSSENFEAYLQAIGVADDQRAKAHEMLEKTGASGLVEEYAVTPGTSVKRTLYLGGQQVRESQPIPIGKDIPNAPSLDGRTCQLKVTENSADKITRHEVFGSIVSDTTYELKGDELVATLSAGGVTSVRKYKRV
jgi:hypothetical protein